MKLLNKKIQISLILILCCFFFVNAEIEVKVNSYLHEFIMGIPTKKNMLPIDEKIHNKIIGKIKTAAAKLWIDYQANKSGANKLPSCVQAAFDDFIKSPVILQFAEDGHPGDIWGWNSPDGFLLLVNALDADPRELASYLFHEMLHASLKKHKDPFCVRIVTEVLTLCANRSTVSKYKCTNNKNFPSDEGVIEDCQMELFPTPGTPGRYQELYELDFIKYKSGEDKEGARMYNPPGNDCTEEKLCKKKDEECNDKCPEDEKCPEEIKDQMDENYSYSLGNLTESQLAPKALIYKSGFYDEAQKLTGGLIWDGKNSATELLRISKVLILPSGSLFSQENDTSFKTILDQYVRHGGSLIVLCQQYGSHYNAIPRPEGSQLRALGWRESQSCTWGSLYFDKENMHPVLSAMTNEKVSVAVDGEFPVYPENSRILLRRIANNEPALLYYPVGNGFVFLSNTYQDWGTSHSQETVSGLKLFRQLVDFAQSPALAVPMFNLTENPTPTITGTYRIKNITDTPAVKVKLFVLSPDRATVLYETEQTISLAPGEERVLPLSFTLPAIQPKDYGICHVDYELYDSTDNLLDMPQESLEGRFAVYKIYTDYTPPQGVSFWLTTDSEKVFLNTESHFILHARNTSSTEVTVNCTYEWVHDGQHPLVTLTIPAGKSVEYPFTLNTGGTMLWVYPLGYGKIGKGLQIVPPRTSSVLDFNHYWGLKVGQPISYSIQSFNTTDKPFSGKINLSLSTKGTQQTLFSTTKEFAANGSFSSGGLYTPNSGIYSTFPAWKLQTCQLKLEVEKPNGTVETQIRNMAYFLAPVSGSDFKMASTYPGNTLRYGQEYPFNITLMNLSDSYGEAALRFDIEDAQLMVNFVDEDGKVCGTKTIAGISLVAGENRTYNDTIPFLPKKSGNYRLEAVYHDETNQLAKFKTTTPYNYLAYSNVTHDADVYRYLDTAHILVTVGGYGNYTLKFNSPEAGIQEERVVSITGDPIARTELFAVPIGYNTNHSYTLEVVGDNGHSKTYVSSLPIRYIIFQPEFVWDKPQYKEGDMVQLKVKINEIAGYLRPLAAQLHLYAPDCQWETTESVILQPGIENEFPYSIQLPASPAILHFPVIMELYLAGKKVLVREPEMVISDARVKIGVLPTQLTQGQKVAFTLENEGGKSREYEIRSYIKDIHGNLIFQYTGTRTLVPNLPQDVEVTIPPNVKEGDYISFIALTRVDSGEFLDNYARHTISGITANLNAPTRSDTFVESQHVSGQAEITVSGGNLENGILRGEIIKYITGTGITTLKEGGLTTANKINGGISHNGKLYLYSGLQLIEYDPLTREFQVIVQAPQLESPILNALFDSAGALWLATEAAGVYKKDIDGTWTHFTPADGLISIYINDIIQYRYPDHTTSIWVATNDGLSEYKNNQWTSYNTVSGVSLLYSWKFTLEGTANLWISTVSGLIQFNGTLFTPVNTPFDTSQLYSDLTGCDDGSVWMFSRTTIYKYKSGTWNQWPINTISPGIFIFNVCADGTNAWFCGGDRLVKYDGNFTVYYETDFPEIKAVNHIIPFAGPGVFFSFNPTEKMGLLSFFNDTWDIRYIEKDKEQFLGSPTRLVLDESGKLWVGSKYGLSQEVENGWHNYLALPDEKPLGRVFSLQAIPGGGVYVGCEGGALKITGSTIERLPDKSGSNGSCNFVVDRLSRLWTVIGGEFSQIFYYDQEWVEYGYYSGSISALVPDQTGGVWVVSSRRLLHIHNDLSEVTYTSTNTPLFDAEVLNFFVDSKDHVWLVKENESNEANALFFFDGNNWTLFDQTHNFPAGAMVVTEDTGTGQILLLCRVRRIENEEGANNSFTSALYTFVDNKFVLFKEGFFVPSIYQMMYDWNQKMVSGNGLIYCVGDLESEDMENLLKISGATGMEEKRVWTGNYSVTVNPTLPLQIDIQAGNSFTAGTYDLKTTLLSSFGQTLAQSRYPFTVTGIGMALTLKDDPDYPYGRYVKQNTDWTLTVGATNNTMQLKENLVLQVKSISPAGVEQLMLDKPLTLANGEKKEESIIFNQQEVGTWKIVADILEGTQLLSRMELPLVVIEPHVSMEIHAPIQAGDSPVAVQIKLANSSRVPLQLELLGSNMNATAPNIDAHFTLEPQEERLFSFSESITTDTTYTIELSGDVSISREIMVTYGYKEQFLLEILPFYPEGLVVPRFSVANIGALSFVSTLYFQLFRVGDSQPILTTTRRYNMVPGDPVIQDNLELELAAGNYILKSRTDKSPWQDSIFIVQPSGIGTVTQNAMEKQLPGTLALPFTLTNSDALPGRFQLNIQLTGPGNALLVNDTRHLFLQPQQSLETTLDLPMLVKGDYLLTISGAKLTAPVSRNFRVLDAVERDIQIAIADVDTARIPVTVSVFNSGYDDFTGNLVILAADGATEEYISVPSGGNFSGSSYLETTNFSKGPHVIKAFMYDSAGALAATSERMVNIIGADIRVSQVPQNLEIEAGSFVPIALSVKNQGNIKGRAIIEVSTMETLHKEIELDLAPGEEKVIEDITIDVPDDLPGGNYFFKYTLSGSGVENGLSSSVFSFKVIGADITATASLDRSLYNVGETARLFLTITSKNQGSLLLDAAVNWGTFTERREFTLSGGSTTLEFEIPLEEFSESKIFYAISFPGGGKGIYLNDIYLRFRDTISIETDKQVYEPGSLIYAVFSAEQPGIITAMVLGDEYKLNISSSTSASLAIPEDTLGGTYTLNWYFEPGDPLQPVQSGTYKFDVSGLIVKQADARLEKEQYNRGDLLKSLFLFESNRNEDVELRCWLNTPTNQTTPLGTSNLTLASGQQTPATTSFSIETSEAGTHYLLYALFKKSDRVLCGRLGFNVGDAVLAGLCTGAAEYPQGNESVDVHIDYFGTGSALLRLLLNDSIVEERSISMSGTGSLDITINNSLIPAGWSSLKATLFKDGLTSTASTRFIYGSNLPDLEVLLLESKTEGLDYQFTIAVRNVGKSMAPASTLAFFDNHTRMESVSIPELQAGDTFSKSFIFPGMGKAGNHLFEFIVDKENMVKEFSEDNNSLSQHLEIPLLFYTLDVDPLFWPAKTNIVLISHLTNNSANLTPLNMHMEIRKDSNNEIIFQRDRMEELPAFGTKSSNDNFNTGTFPAGQYTVSQTLTGENVHLSESISVAIRNSKVLFATMDLLPTSIPAGVESAINIQMNIKNDGNVPLEGETLILEVVNSDSQQKMASTEIVVSLAIGQEIMKSVGMNLNIAEGVYDIQLQFLQHTITSTQLNVVPSIKQEKRISIRPRILLMDANFPGAFSSVDFFVSSLLRNSGVEYELGQGLLASLVKLQKGHHNIIVLSGHLLGNKLPKELQERVWRGEGLIWFCTNPLPSPALEAFLGVRVKPAPSKFREKEITLLSSPLCGDGEVELQAKNHLMLTELSQDTVILGRTKQSAAPVMACRKYGKGQILVIALPMQFVRGADTISQLVLNAISQFSQDIYSFETLAPVLPIEVAISNESSVEKKVELRESLPYGVEAYDFNPKLAIEDELKWLFTIPAGGRTVLNYWLRLPDQIGTYSVKTEFYEGANKQDEAVLNVEVEQTIFAHLNALISQLEWLEVSGSDARLVKRSLQNLERIRTRNWDNPSDCLLNLLDSVEATSALGEIKNTNVDILRFSAGDIMIAMGQRLFQKIETLNTSNQSALLKMLTQ